MFTNTCTLGKSGGLLEPQLPHLYNGMLLLTLFGFLPRLNENMKGVVVVIAGIKRAISRLINVENVSVWMPKDKGPSGPFRTPSSVPCCWECVLVSVELQNNGFCGVGSAAIHTPQGMRLLS